MKTYITVECPEQNNIHRFILNAVSLQSGRLRVDRAFMKFGIEPMVITSDLRPDWHFNKYGVLHTVTINNKYELRGNMHTKAFY